MTQQARILLVDDEPLNLEILSEYLDDPRYILVSAENGAQAWDCLQQAEEPFDVVVLDRMMPVMNGMQLLAKIKADARFATLPVILQTAAASKDQIAEGLRQGAFYYLAKPYEREILVSILESALKDHWLKRALQAQIKNRDSVIGLLTQGQFSFQTLDEARQLATFLAALCPQPETTVIGLAELLINAVEHGNLAISYEDKTRLNEKGCWQEEIERRLQQPEYTERRVCVDYRRQGSGLQFTITDEGAGFKPDAYLEMRTERAFDSHGRGIAMARMLSFSRLEYQGKGNVVVAEIAAVTGDR